ncbi:MAG: transporter ATP-binding protein [Acidimicrobiales bacterium]|nr:transporter ATP-binding protein [Acidimicrobiales bacterium]
MSSERSGGPLLTFTDVVKQFPVPGRAPLARSALPIRAATTRGTTALDRVSFSVSAGEVLGVIGPNGAGKSTVLKVAAGILQPTSGRVEVSGLPASIIELGFSFHPDLTGWENLRVAGALNGVPRDQLERLVDQIVEFSGLEDYMGQQVKHFSTGMSARLGFAIAIHVPSSVLLIDEVLAVGDRSFQQACVERVRYLAGEGAAIVFVSHSLELVNQVCDRALCLVDGRVVDDGDVAEVVARYSGGVIDRLDQMPDPPAVIADLQLGETTIESGDFLEVTCLVDVSDPTRALTLRSELGLPLQGEGRAINVDRLLDRLDRPGRWELRARIGPLSITAGRMELSVALVELATTAVVDRQRLPFTVLGQDTGVVLIAMHGTWSAERVADDHVHQEPPPPPPTGGVVWCDDVSKVFSRRRRSQEVEALEHITFALDAGESLGIIGPNGAGKSTLLRVLAGISDATTGTVRIEGTMATVLELGTEFHGDLTGAENLEFAWRLHGGSAEDSVRARQAITELADLGDVMDRPVKHYSSGMAARLAVALALESGADVLLIDEALSVGDLEFRERVRRRLATLVRNGATVLFATHDLHLLALICNRVLRLDAGRLVDDGPADAVITNAGGAGWAGGTSAADGGVILHDLRVAPEIIDWRQPFDVELTVEVLRPTANAYLEFSIRNTIPPEDRSRVRTAEEVLMSTLCLQRIEDLGDLLTTPGRKVVRGRIEGVPLLNTLDVVVGVVDEFDAQVLSEQWRTVFFGAHGTANARVEVEWAAARASGPGRTKTE